MTAPERDVGTRESAPTHIPAGDAPAALGGGLTSALGSTQVLALQRTAGNAATTRWLATARAPSAQPRRGAAEAAGGTPVNRIGVVDPADEPYLRLRRSPDTGRDNVIARLRFGQRLQVIKQLPGDWYYVSTPGGKLGYVGSKYVRVHLPEPGARLHLVKGGREGFAINIASRYFSKSVHRGQDLRFFVNAIAWVNRVPIPKSSDGWKHVQFEADRRIWVPSLAFAQSLKGQISTGSATWDALDKAGIGDMLRRTDQLINDLGRAIEASKRHLGPAIRRHVVESLWNAMISLALLMIGAIAVMALFTGAGAAIGGLATGGAGAGIGAQAGLKLAQVFLNWLGLGFMLVWLGQAVSETVGAFGRFLSAVWNARSDPRKLEAAGKHFAEAIGTLLGNLLEGAVLYLAAVGAGAGIAKLRGSRLGKTLGAPFERFVRERASGRDERVENPPKPVRSDGQATARVRERLGDHAVDMLEKKFGRIGEFENLASSVKGRTRPKDDTAPTLRAHLEKVFQAQPENDVMLKRMAEIAAGRRKPEQVDIDFLQHELLEYGLMKKGVPHDYEPLPGGRPGQQWAPAHDITFSVLGVKDVYSRDAHEAARRQSAGGRDQ